MPDEKQLGLLRDILDSAKTIREYLRGVTHVHREDRNTAANVSRRNS